ncbi:hypothetical protein TRFO_02336 [Tritrichomonas foetus]|uniref:RING-type domain-containing protein n=1 Tax=Tritrichomonas foetus TaxID=1144522 RepID=A0A1J4J548_9EUKA|nr:hypothetical protein TRFO_02336 [Tritrichomonas foetus]|eukprot:OHS93817.1 hypothetical protein TRFO_02336 [Tritrichomonas foetus]
MKRGNYVNEMNDSGLTPLYVAVSLKRSNVVKNLLDHNADPSHEVHPSFKLAQEMDDKEISSILSGAGAKNVSTRSARLDARRTRGTTPTSRMGRRNRNAPQQVVPDDEPPKSHNEGMCYICERNKVTQKLIPCEHVVSCRGCIKKFIEEHLPCPVCKLSFYATSTVTEEATETKQ